MFFKPSELIFIEKQNVDGGGNDDDDVDDKKDL